MQALVLCGGLGTRLSSLLGDRPKPMATVAGRPFLEYLLLQLRQQDFVDVILCTGHQGKYIEEYFDCGERWGIHLRYSQEQERLGTAGAIRLAVHLVEGDDFCVFNGDSFFDADLPRLNRYHEEKGALATIALAHKENSQRYGSVVINASGEIKGFFEKTEEQAGWINGGIYVFDREIANYIPPGQAVSLEQEIFPNLIGQRFYGLPFPSSYLVDIGTPKDYLRLVLP